MTESSSPQVVSQTQSTIVLKDASGQQQVYVNWKGAGLYVKSQDVQGFSQYRAGQASPMASVYDVQNNKILTIPYYDPRTNLDIVNLSVAPQKLSQYVAYQQQMVANQEAAQKQAVIDAAARAAQAAKQQEELTKARLGYAQQIIQSYSPMVEATPEEFAKMWTRGMGERIKQYGVLSSSDWEWAGRDLGAFTSGVNRRIGELSGYRNALVGKVAPTEIAKIDVGLANLSKIRDVYIPASNKALMDVIKMPHQETPVYGKVSAPQPATINVMERIGGTPENPVMGYKSSSQNLTVAEYTAKFGAPAFEVKEGFSYAVTQQPASKTPAMPSGLEAEYKQGAQIAPVGYVLGGGAPVEPARTEDLQATRVSDITGRTEVLVPTTKSTAVSGLQPQDTFSQLLRGDTSSLTTKQTDALGQGVSRIVNQPAVTTGLSTVKSTPATLFEEYAMEGGKSPVTLASELGLTNVGGQFGLKTDKGFEKIAGVVDLGGKQKQFVTYKADDSGYNYYNAVGDLTPKEVAKYNEEITQKVIATKTEPSLFQSIAKPFVDYNEGLSRYIAGEEVVIQRAREKGDVVSEYGGIMGAAQARTLQVLAPPAVIGAGLGAAIAAVPAVGAFGTSAALLGGLATPIMAVSGGVLAMSALDAGSKMAKGAISALDTYTGASEKQSFLYAEKTAQQQMNEALRGSSTSGTKLMVTPSYISGVKGADWTKGETLGKISGADYALVPKENKLADIQHELYLKSTTLEQRRERDISVGLEATQQVVETGAAFAITVVSAALAADYVFSLKQPKVEGVMSAGKSETRILEKPTGGDGTYKTRVTSEGKAFGITGKKTVLDVDSQPLLFEERNPLYPESAWKVEAKPDVTGTSVIDIKTSGTATTRVFKEQALKEFKEYISGKVGDVKNNMGIDATPEVEHPFLSKAKDVFASIFTENKNIRETPSIQKSDFFTTAKDPVTGQGAIYESVRVGRGTVVTGVETGFPEDTAFTLGITKFRKLADITKEGKVISDIGKWQLVDKKLPLDLNIARMTGKDSYVQLDVSNINKLTIAADKGIILPDIKKVVAEKAKGIFELFAGKGGGEGTDLRSVLEVPPSKGSEFREIVSVPSSKIESVSQITKSADLLSINAGKVMTENAIAKDFIIGLQQKAAVDYGLSVAGLGTLYPLMTTLEKQPQILKSDQLYLEKTIQIPKGKMEMITKTSSMVSEVLQQSIQKPSMVLEGFKTPARPDYLVLEYKPSILTVLTQPTYPRQQILPPIVAPIYDEKPIVYPPIEIIKPIEVIVPPIEIIKPIEIVEPIITPVVPQPIPPIQTFGKPTPPPPNEFIIPPFEPYTPGQSPESYEFGRSSPKRRGKRKKSPSITAVEFPEIFGHGKYPKEPTGSEIRPLLRKTIAPRIKMGAIDRDTFGSRAMRESNVPDKYNITQMEKRKPRARTKTTPKRKVVKFDIKKLEKSLSKMNNFKYKKSKWL